MHDRFTRDLALCTDGFHDVEYYSYAASEITSSYWSAYMKLDLQICNQKYMAYYAKCADFEILRFHKISSSLYKISSELWTLELTT